MGNEKKRGSGERNHHWVVSGRSLKAGPGERAGVSCDIPSGVKGVDHAQIQQFCKPELSGPD